jgi:hypothetical protein
MAGDPMDVELAFATMDQLVEEIRKRVTAMALVTETHDDDGANMTLYRKGSTSHVVGLVEVAKQQLFRITAMPEYEDDDT